MPIYEFYCPACHRIFSFLSRAVNTERRPACPRCARPEIERRASAFAISKGRPEPTPGGADDPPDFDDARMEQAMEGLAREAEGLSEDDPRAMATMMRRFYERTGMPMGRNIEEALARMQAGEDPDEIEDELGDALDAEDPFGGVGAEPQDRSTARRLRRRLLPPSVDRTLYEL